MIKKNFEGGSFAKIPNELLQKNKLSAEARGILCSVLSYPSNFRMSRGWLMNSFSLSDYKLRSILKELREVGVLEDKIVRDKAGAIISRELVLDITDRSKYKLQ